MISVSRYTPADCERWNRFVAASKNANFLFQREYMDYHADRFKDHSLLLLSRNEIVGLIPANQAGDSLVSHGGLTYGGVLSDERMKSALMLEAFQVLADYLRKKGIQTLRYKAVPHIYHVLPAEEDLYALFRVGATLVRRDVAASIPSQGRAAYDKGRVRRLTGEDRMELARSDDFEDFMALSADVLDRHHGTKPVHTPAEMRLLAGRFPDCIKLFTATRAGSLLAGMIVYESARVAHVQYLASSEEGRKAHASDLLTEHLVREVYAEKAWFDFGISTEDDGKHLNEGLASFKEKFGARAVVYDTYELVLGARSGGEPDHGRSEGH